MQLSPLRSAPVEMTMPDILRGQTFKTPGAPGLALETWDLLPPAQRLAGPVQIRLLFRKTKPEQMLAAIFP